MNRIFIDIETPNHQNDRICQLGYVIDNGGKIIEEKSILINPQTEFDIEFSALHGINTRIVKDCPTFIDVWNEYKSLFHEAIIVGHYVSFDLHVLDTELKRYDQGKLKISYEDTCEKATYLVSKSSKKLKSLAEYFRLPEYRAHDALEDAKTTRLLYYQLGELEPWDIYDCHNVIIGQKKKAL